MAASGFYLPGRLQCIRASTTCMHAYMRINKLIRSSASLQPHYKYRLYFVPKQKSRLLLFPVPRPPLSSPLLSLHQQYHPIKHPVSLKTIGNGNFQRVRGCRGEREVAGESGVAMVCGVFCGGSLAVENTALYIRYGKQSPYFTKTHFGNASPCSNCCPLCNTRVFDGNQKTRIFGLSGAPGR